MLLEQLSERLSISTGFGLFYIDQLVAKAKNEYLTDAVTLEDRLRDVSHSGSHVARFA